MLRGLLRNSEAAKALFEKVGLFKTPEVLEKYVIASEVTVEVLDVFLSRLLGTERAPIGDSCGDLAALWESLGCVSLNDRKGSSGAGEDLPARAGQPDRAAEELRVKVQDLERQLCAVQRQLHMQGEVSQLAASLDDRLDEIARECERRVSTVSEDVVRLEREVSDRARNGEVQRLIDDVSSLKDAERRLDGRISDAEKKATEADEVLRNEIQAEIKRLDAVTKLIPVGPLLNGIIAHLARKCGGNVHEKGSVEVTARGYGGGDLKNVVELGTNSCLCINNGPNAWIRYDFKGWRVAPTSYSIRSDNCAYPKSWVFEVSNDGSDSSWKVVDRRENNGDLNGDYLTRNFALSYPPGEGFRFVRLRQTGKNHGGNDYFLLTSLEVFGTLSPQ